MLWDLIFIAGSGSAAYENSVVFVVSSTLLFKRDQSTVRKRLLPEADDSLVGQ